MAGRGASELLLPLPGTDTQQDQEFCCTNPDVFLIELEALLPTQYRGLWPEL